MIRRNSLPCLKMAQRAPPQNSLQIAYARLLHFFGRDSGGTNPALGDGDFGA
jgi:hypothetical protein